MMARMDARLEILMFQDMREGLDKLAAMTGTDASGKVRMLVAQELYRVFGADWLDNDLDKSRRPIK